MYSDRKKNDRQALAAGNIIATVVSTVGVLMVAPIGRPIRALVRMGLINFARVPLPTAVAAWNRSETGFDVQYLSEKLDANAHPTARS